MIASLFQVDNNDVVNKCEVLKQNAEKRSLKGPKIKVEWSAVESKSKIFWEGSANRTPSQLQLGGLGSAVNFPAGDERDAWP